MSWRPAYSCNTPILLGLWIFGGMTSLNEVLQWSDADSLERVGRQREGVALYVREFIIALLGDGRGANG